jgi:AcrR family transcriptional regulator
MAIPYEASGRRAQKGRTRAALIGAARVLLAEGATPTVESTADRAGISRTTAYRYFPTQRRLLMAAYPEVDSPTLLDESAPPDPAERLDRVLDGLARINTDWEPHLRTALRLSLEEPRRADPPIMRRGRAIGWIEDALAPLRQSHPDIDVRTLAVAIRSATGIEAKVWLTDVAGLSDADATATARWAAQAMLQHAIDGGPLPAMHATR